MEPTRGAPKIYRGAPLPKNSNIGKPEKRKSQEDAGAVQSVKKLRERISIPPQTEQSKLVTREGSTRVKPDLPPRKRDALKAPELPPRQSNIAGIETGELAVVKPRPQKVQADQGLLSTKDMKFREKALSEGFRFREDSEVFYNENTKEMMTREEMKAFLKGAHVKEGTSSLLKRHTEGMKDREEVIENIPERQQKRKELRQPIPKPPGVMEKAEKNDRGQT